MSSPLFGPADIRTLAARLGVRPTKTLGQNFVHDPNTIRRIVRAAELANRETVLERYSTAAIARRYAELLASLV